MPLARPDGSPWPRISIVTPSYNQGQFIEETIRSVLLQGYPDLEYIIMDGGSTGPKRRNHPKNTEAWLTYWVSENDGRSVARDQQRFPNEATGVLLSWLNSDDVSLPDGISGLSQRVYQAPL